MIISRQKDFEKILQSVKGYDRIFLLGCGDCATTCKSGGEQELLALKERLVLAGKTVTGLVVPEVSCVASKIKLALGKNRELLKDTQVILVFACGSAVASVQENDRLGLRVLPGCDTLFGAIIDGAGNFAERCSACGECLLDVTEGVCPVTRCSKGVLNGPCGGVKDGKCEVDKDRDCAWVLIYRRFKDKGQLDKFVKINKPKDYSRSVKPRHI